MSDEAFPHGPDPDVERQALSDAFAPQPTRNAAEAGTVPPAPGVPLFTTEGIAALATALSAALLDMAGAVKDAKNPHLRTTYADLAAVCAATKDPLAREGLAIAQLAESAAAFQMLVQEEEKDGSLRDRYVWASNVRVTTYLIHRDGGALMTTGVMTAVKAKGTTLIQAVGSLTSYLRRYQHMAIVGLPAVDDDGNGNAPESKRSSSQEIVPKGSGR